MNSAEDLAALSSLGHIDGALHAIAFAPGDALGGNFMSAPPESAEGAFRTSAYSLKALSVAMLPLMEDGGAIVGIVSLLPDDDKGAASGDRETDVTLNLDRLLVEPNRRSTPVDRCLEPGATGYRFRTRR